MARPRKALLTREKVVDAAIAVIGVSGLEMFSMHKLATALGVRAPSLYHYFTDKNALLEAVAREITAVDSVPDAPVPGGDWADYLIAQAVALRGRIVRHPQCAPLLVQFMPRAEVFGDYGALCGYLESCGVPAQLHVRIVDGLTALTIGAAILGENVADQVFAVYLQTYLDGVRSEMPGNGTGLTPTAAE